MTLSRSQLIGGIAGVVILALAIYGVWLAANPANPYKGLVTEKTVQMDDATRDYFEQRLSITLAAIEAAEASGGEVDLDLYLSAASDAHSLGDLVMTREMLEKQLAGNALNIVAWNNYALVLEEMQDFEKAEAAFQKTLSIENQVAKYYVDYADFLLDNFPDRHDDVKVIIEDNLDVEGQTVWNMVALADWYEAEGECEKAVDHYEVAVVLDPTSQALKDDFAALKQSCNE